MDKSKQTILVYDKIAQEYAKEFARPSEYINEFLNNCLCSDYEKSNK